MNWRRMLLAGALVGVSIWCLGLVQQVHSEQVELNRAEPKLRAAEPSADSVVEAAEPVPPHPGMPG